ncbi:MAG: energy-coupling factor ABC transporter ATP-binding protein, partial [Candidatus Ranarchaeia archaeon]
MNLIELSNVSFTYPNNFRAIDKINLEIKKGQSIALMGENGSGKTTLIKLISGLYKPTSGDVLINKLNTKQEKIRDFARIISFVTQNPDTQIFEKTVFDEVSYALKNFKVEKSEIPKIVISELSRFGLTKYTNALPTGLSGGERKSVVFASATATNPKLFLLDEPTRGLDYKRKQRMFEIMEYFRSKGSS